MLAFSPLLLSWGLTRLRKTTQGCRLSMWLVAGLGRCNACKADVPMTAFTAFAPEFNGQLAVGQKANTDVLSFSLGIRNSPIAMTGTISKSSLMQSLQERSWDVSDRKVRVQPTTCVVHKGNYLRRIHSNFRNFCLMVSVDVVNNICPVCFPFYQDGDSLQLWFLSVLCVAGFLSGPDSWKEAAEGQVTHLIAEEVGVPEKWEGLVSRAVLKHTLSFWSNL